MCEAAVFSMFSANSWSLMEGSEIFFTITEWPLTAVATALVLISFSLNSFEIALDTVPESTIMESTTMSEASGSSPRCATSIPARVFLSSTALMLEEPTSRPTIVFDPIPNMCPPFVAPVLPAFSVSCHRLPPRRLEEILPSPLQLLLRSRSFRLAFRPRFNLAGLLFHPLVQLRLLETPAVAHLARRNSLFPDVLVKRVRTHSQVLRCLTNIHHFSRVGHSP